MGTKNNKGKSWSKKNRIKIENEAVVKVLSPKNKRAKSALIRRPIPHYMESRKVYTNFEQALPKKPMPKKNVKNVHKKGQRLVKQVK